MLFPNVKYLLFYRYIKSAIRGHPKQSPRIVSRIGNSAKTPIFIAGGWGARPGCLNRMDISGNFSSSEIYRPATSPLFVVQLGRFCIFSILNSVRRRITDSSPQLDIQLYLRPSPIPNLRGSSETPH